MPEERTRVVGYVTVVTYPSTLGAFLLQPVVLGAAHLEACFVEPNLAFLVVASERSIIPIDL